MNLNKNISRLWNLFFCLICIASIVWGLKVLFYEGIVHSIPRNFNGDFYAATFGDLQVTDRVFYGPLYSLLWGVVQRYPSITIKHFAIASMLLYFLALFICLQFSKLPKALNLFCIALSLCFFPAIISVSVAAFPEIFELFLICLAINFALQKKYGGEILCISFAAFMKFIPWFLMIPIALSRRWRGLINSAVLFFIIAIIVSFVNNFTIIQTVVESVFPLGGTMSYVGPLGPSGEFSGLPEFFLRFTTSVMGDGSTLIYLNNSYGFLVMLISGMIIAVCLIITIGFTLFLNLNEKNDFSPIRVKEIYLLWICLLPILTLRSHPHTFILLIPSFFLIAGIIFGQYLSIKKKYSTFLSLIFIIALYLISYIWIGFRPARYWLLNFFNENSILGQLWKDEMIIGNLLLFFNSFLLIILVHSAKQTICNSEARVR